MGALSVSRRRSRGLRKTPQWSAERRAGPRYGPAIPFRRRDGSRRKADQRPRRIPRLRISALRYPLMEGRRVRNRQFGRKPAGIRRAAAMPHTPTNGRHNEWMEETTMMLKFVQIPLSVVPGLCRASTPCFVTKEGVDGWDIGERSDAVLQTAMATPSFVRLSPAMTNVGSEQTVRLPRGWPRCHGGGDSK